MHEAFYDCNDKPCDYHFQISLAVKTYDVFQDRPILNTT